MEKQLQSLGARLDAMSEKAKSAGADAKDEQRKLIAELKAKRCFAADADTKKAQPELGFSWRGGRDSNPRPPA
ncbi:MAG TPA: hypothetical protein RMF84_02210 [Polyangiaceae bacterium LLY-WYZ-14_1]|nr:hypothetical protein [Polyangiaceae bacterium LLY-WYZ-14_1]